jgi:hypothetical protein
MDKRDCVYDLNVTDIELFNTLRRLINDNDATWQRTEPHRELTNSLISLFPKGKDYDKIKEKVDSLVHPGYLKFRIYKSLPESHYKLHTDGYCKSRINAIISNANDNYATEFFDAKNDTFLNVSFRQDMLTVFNTMIPHRVHNYEKEKCRYVFSVEYSMPYEELLKFMLEK